MRIRLVLLTLLTLVLGACASPSDPAVQPAATTPSTTAVSQAATARRSQAKGPPPPGIIATARRQPAPALLVTAFDGSTVSLDGFRGRPAGPRSPSASCRPAP